MALANYALPIGHLASGISQLSFCLGRDYLQPVDIAQFANTHIEGLECWLENTTAHRTLYAMFNGTLSYNPLDKKLILKPNAVDASDIGDIWGFLETKPDQVFYNYPESTDVSQAIIDILNSEYSNSSSTHPILENVFRSTKQTLKDYLSDEDSNGNLTQAITSIANSFASGSTSLSVQAGDVIGLAGDPPTGLSLPAGCSLPPMGNNKYIFLEILDYASFHMDPTYYLWRFLRDEHIGSNPNTHLISSAPKRSNNTFDHPLLDAIGIDLDVERKPRAIINTTLPGQGSAQDVLLFPLEKLRDWHGAKLGTDNSNREISLIQWRITNNNNLDLQLRRKPGENSQDYKLCGETFSGGVNICPSASSTALMQQIWNDWGNDIHDICRILQFPSEIVAATIGHETLSGGNVHPRAIRLEPINQSIKQNLIDNGISATVAQNYYTLTTTGFGWSTSDAGDPNNWVLSNNFSNSPAVITYGDLLDIVQIIPHLISAGLMQTLVDKVGIFINNWLTRDANYSNIQTLFGVDPIPGGYNSHLRWMLTGRNSILLGTTMQKKSITQGNRMSPYMVAAAHNAGRVRPRPRISNILNPFGIRYNGINYPIDIGNNYESIQQLFLNGTNGYNKFFKSK
jgi:hypothetical protein